ncbi:hypothetical protein Tco_0233154 [Tanacetum coccineum]
MMVVCGRVCGGGGLAVATMVVSVVVVTVGSEGDENIGAVVRGHGGVIMVALVTVARWFRDDDVGEGVEGSAMMVVDGGEVVAVVVAWPESGLDLVGKGGAAPEKLWGGSIKNDLRKLKGKDIVNNAAQMSNAATIAPGMYKLDPVILAPKVKNNREAHEYYLKHTIEQAAILREVVEQAKLQNPLDSASYSAFGFHSDHYIEPTEFEMQEMVNILVSGEAY